MDIALKQRLVGASVLIALAVVVLPMLLGGRPEDGSPSTQTIELPPQPPELDFETRRYPIGESPSPARTEPEPPVTRPLPSPGPPARTGAQVPPQPEIAAEEIPREPAPDSESTADEPPAVDSFTEPVGEAAAMPAETGGRYVVQVASFGAVDNANRLSDMLGGYGYSVLMDTIKSDVGTLHRVRVGPFDSESEADAAISRLSTQVDDVRPRVMDLQPNKAAQVTTPSDPLVRWVVQVGSFSSAANAEKLVARLRLEGMSAYSEEVSSSGSTIHRVRVGPFLEREEAIRIDARVRERMSLDGVVMSAD